MPLPKPPGRNPNRTSMYIGFAQTYRHVHYLHRFEKSIAVEDYIPMLLFSGGDTKHLPSLWTNARKVRSHYYDSFHWLGFRVSSDFHSWHIGSVYSLPFLQESAGWHYRFHSHMTTVK